METAVSYRRRGTILIHDWDLMASFLYIGEDFSRSTPPTAINIPILSIATLALIAKQKSLD
jgi:hypothetical protein